MISAKQMAAMEVETNKGRRAEFTIKLPEENTN
jgi:hypothetical protein